MNARKNDNSRVQRVMEMGPNPGQSSVSVRNADAQGQHQRIPDSGWPWEHAGLGPHTPRPVCTCRPVRSPVLRAPVCTPSPGVGHHGGNSHPDRGRLTLALPL